jgi:hypothetical protein
MFYTSSGADGSDSFKGHGGAQFVYGVEKALRNLAHTTDTHHKQTVYIDANYVHY